MIRVLAAVAAALICAQPAVAQSMLGQSVPGRAAAPQRVLPGLTPLGPVQAPLNAPPPASVTTPLLGPGPAIESEPLPPITAPAVIAPAVLPPAAVAPPVAAPAVNAPAVTAPALNPPAPEPSSPPLPAPVVAPGIVPGPAGGADWIARPFVILQGLDKVTARVTTLTGRVGETMRFGTLSVVVRSCVVRPAEVAADAAAFLEVTERGPLFRGWMVASTPGLGVVEHAVYDLRLSGCRT